MPTRLSPWHKMATVKDITRSTPITSPTITTVSHKQVNMHVKTQLLQIGDISLFSFLHGFDTYYRIFISAFKVFFKSLKTLSQMVMLMSPTDVQYK